LTSFDRLTAANEKIANTIPLTVASSKTGDLGINKIADISTGFANDVGAAFGPKSEFKLGMDEFGIKAADITASLAALSTGDIPKIITALSEVTTSLFDTMLSFGVAVTEGIKNKKIDDKTIKDGFFTPKSETLSINDGFKKPTPIGDTIKTPGGSIEIYEKDYFLAATQLPDVLQKSVNKGLMDVLKIQGQSMNAAMMSNNTQRQPETTPQKQEVVHTVNFKISVDGPKNKLTDMLVEELPKNPTLMQYIVKHFDNTKTSGGMTSKK
jgi:hypothetical protein